MCNCDLTSVPPELVTALHQTLRLANAFETLTGRKAGVKHVHALGRLIRRNGLREEDCQRVMDEMATYAPDIDWDYVVGAVVSRMLEAKGEISVQVK